MSFSLNQPHAERVTATPKVPAASTEATKTPPVPTVRPAAPTTRAEEPIAVSAQLQNPIPKTAASWVSLRGVVPIGELEYPIETAAINSTRTRDIAVSFFIFVTSLRVSLSKAASFTWRRERYCPDASGQSTLTVSLTWLSTWISRCEQQGISTPDFLEFGT